MTELEGRICDYIIGNLLFDYAYNDIVEHLALNSSKYSIINKKKVKCVEIMGREDIKIDLK
jgi:hypothetical protein